MMRMIAAMLMCALLTTLTVVDAQDTKGTRAKTQADIMRERAHACKGLRDDALQECLDNYVGPSQDATSGEAEHSGITDKSSQEEGERVERDGSSKADMTKANKRAPDGPIRGGPEESKQ